jgi:hypothetical protein
MRWYFSKNGEVTGPVEVDVASQWAKNGQLGPDWMVRDEASTGWTPIGQSPLAHLLSKKGMGTGAKIALAFAGVVVLSFGGCAVLMIVGAAKVANNTAKAKTEAAAQLSNAAAAVPWVASVQQNCEAYKAAPNEIKKSDVFRANDEVLSAASLNQVRGKLTRMRTNQGGSELDLTIEVGGVEFKTESLLEAIKRGTPVYEAASAMQEGQCVTFTADKVRSSSLVEQSKVCDLEYFANFTRLSNCP